MRQRSAVSGQRSAVSFQFSVFSFQFSVFSFQFSVFSFQFSVFVVCGLPQWATLIGQPSAPRCSTPSVGSAVPAAQSKGALRGPYGFVVQRLCRGKRGSGCIRGDRCVEISLGDETPSA